MKNNDFYGKKCLVTGGMGFIGSHLCAYLHDKGADVVAVDIEKNESGTFFQLHNAFRDIKKIIINLADPSAVYEIIKQSPDIIFHLAGSPYAPYTSTHPSISYYSNVATTANMLEVARIVGVEKFILASSACVFGATSDSPVPVNGKRCRPEHYYTYTKRAAEDLTNSYREFYALPVAICRFVNIYGPGDRHFGRLIPRICQQLASTPSEDITLYRSNGESVFEFLYVDDAVSGLLSAFLHENKTDESVIHFGSGPRGRMKALDVAKQLSRIYDNKVRSVVTKNEGGEKVVKKYLDITNTLKNVKWFPIWDITAGLSDTMNWYKDNIDKLRPFAES